jgi:multiple sugar transport system substrate-binding protein
MKQDAKQMSRRTALGGAAGLVGAVAAACAPGEPQAASKTAPPVTVDWAIHEAYTPAQAEGAKLFSAQHPNVSFNLRPFSDNAPMIAEWVAGAGPHVAMQYGPQLVDSGRKGMLLTLDPYLKKDTKQVPMDDFVSFQLAASEWTGVGRFGLPMYINVYVLYYNKAVFQRKGQPLPDDTWDWTRYQEAMVKLTDKDQNAFGGILPTAGQASSKLHQNGVDVVDPKNPRKSTVAAPEAIEAWQWMHDRLWREGSWGQRDIPTKVGFKNAQAMMFGGKLATQENGSGSLVDTIKNFAESPKDWDVAPLPKKKERAARASIDSWVVVKHAPQPDTMWEFMKFLQTPEYTDIQARLGGAQHARISQQDRFVDVMKKAYPEIADKNVQAFSHAVKNKYARPQAVFVTKDDDAWKIINDAWSATMVRNEQPVADALRDAARRIDALLAGS